MIRGHRGDVGRQRASGFTLLEALIAIAIAAMALGAMARSVGQSARTVAEVTDRQQAAMVARSVLSMGTFAEDFMATTQGQAGMWTWRVQVRPQTTVLHDVVELLPDQTVTVAHLTVEVSSPDRDAPIYVLSAWKPYRSAP